MPAPGQFILNKQVIPSELRSREWEAARVDYWRMERAFVMAGKVRFEDAQACRNAAAALANGKVSLIEARRAVREELERAGYRPTPGTAGTIKDIYTPRRLDVTLKTNVNMARGYAEKNRLTGNAMYPASELHRNRQSREPRDWQTRWNEAAASVNYEGVARDGSFIALNDSPIWAALSRWRTPYPPFDYGSGMWWRPVKWRVAEKKGLVTDEDMARIESQRPESFNHDVALDTNVTMVQQYKLKFTTQYIAPEVIQLAFGVAGELEDNQEAVPFVSNGEIKVWLYGRLTDHAENGKELMEWCVMGRLRLTNTPNFASDPATAEWELSIEYSPLQKLTPKALASPATA